MEPETVIAAVQAAALASDYALALTLLREHGFVDCCIGCGVVSSDYKFTIHETEIVTCQACTEEFARWLVDPKRDRTGRSSLESAAQKR